MTTREVVSFCRLCVAYCGIVVTVDLLTTGVDIPDLEFIVFLRPVKSRILFEQMLGRGTRKGEKHPFSPK